MKRLLGLVFLFSVGLVGTKNLFGQMKKIETLNPLMATYQLLQGKMAQFCATAIQSFGAENYINSQQVLSRLKEGMEDLQAQEVAFQDADSFLGWIAQQKNTILVLYDQDNVKSAVCLEYIKYLSDQHFLSFDWYVTSSDRFDLLVNSLLSQNIDLVQPTQIVPNVLFIIDGYLWQIPDDQAAKHLKYWIDRQAELRDELTDKEKTDPVGRLKVGE
jgi:hypothetical protein